MFQELQDEAEGDVQPSADDYANDIVGTSVFPSFPVDPGYVNRFQAMLPYMGAKKGSFFYGGVSPSKIGLIAPY
jgi:hypothetical protein